MKFYGFEKLSLIDYDGHTSATVFTGGCNFYCPFCHNGGLVDLDRDAQVFSEEEILAYLKKRAGLLDGLAITGGEPTLHKDLPNFIRKVKSLGYDVKLDSNGTNPEMLCNLIEEGIVDYFAMDIKNSPEKYPATVGKSTCDMAKINESVDILIKSGKRHEFRTTAIAEFMDENDFRKIADWIEGADKYVIQHYRDSEGCISHGYAPIDEETAAKYLAIVGEKVKTVALRGY